MHQWCTWGTNSLNKIVFKFNKFGLKINIILIKKYFIFRFKYFVIFGMASGQVFTDVEQADVKLSGQLDSHFRDVNRAFGKVGWIFREVDRTVTKVLGIGRGWAGS